MTDTSNVSPDAATAAGTSAPATSPPASAQPAGDPLGDLPADQAVFDRGYVEKIRGEASRYRTEARTAAEQLQGYEQVYGNYEPEDREVWFALARQWEADPSQAAAAMKEIAERVLGDQAPAATPPAATPPQQQTTEQWMNTGNPEPLTADQVQQLINDALSQRDTDAAHQRAVDDVFNEVRAAGFDPETSEGFMVLYEANHFTAGDINAAVERIKARDQKIIDDYVAGRRQNFAAPAPNGGVSAASAPEPIKNLDDAKKAADQFLRERRAAQ